MRGSAQTYACRVAMADRSGAAERNRGQRRKSAPAISLWGTLVLTRINTAPTTGARMRYGRAAENIPRAGHGGPERIYDIS